MSFFQLLELFPLNPLKTLSQMTEFTIDCNSWEVGVNIPQIICEKVISLQNIGNICFPRFHTSENKEI